MDDDKNLIDVSGNGTSLLSELLPRREPIIGEDAARFDAFRQKIFDSLSPVTTYECVQAQRLVDIEWDIDLHRQMRNATLSSYMRHYIRGAVVRHKEAEHASRTDRLAEKQLNAGRSNEERRPQGAFDRASAEMAGNALAEQAVAQDEETRTAAEKQIAALGLKPIELLAQAFTSDSAALIQLEEKIKELERRAREVKRDFDALVKSCPLQSLYDNRQVAR